MKNPNGYGSISYLGKKRRRPYMVRVTTGHYYDKKTNTTQLKRNIVGYYPTRKEAMIALAKYNTVPHALESNNLTFKEIYELWSMKGLEGLSKSAHMSYAAAFKNASTLHNKPITNIKTDDMQQIIDSLHNKSKSTIDNVVIVFHKVFRYALQRDIVTKDYSQYIVVNRSNENKTAIHKTFTSEELSLLWKESGNITFEYSPSEWLLILIYTGMRPSELTGMKRENVYIDKHYMIGGVKTAQSKNRIIPIHDDILEIVSKYYNECNDYLLSQPNGKQFTTAYFRNIIKKFCKEENMDHLPHDGRHTFATFAKRSQIDEFYIQKIMGHAHTTITNNVYTHVTPDELVLEVNKIRFK